ncbi:short-chain dehydrogenase [Fluviicola sp.]|uniref:short-chain dehydrogenase n=1 Tax=Fluviicola sp. TaxID=1917219 RepID=UPI0031D34B54
MKKLFYLTCLLLLTACTSEKTDEELLEQDREALRENLISGKVVPYKFVKLMFRGYASDDTGSAEFKAFKKESDGLVQKIMELDHADELSIKDCWSMYQVYTQMDDFVTKTDEDQFPTIVDAFSKHWNGTKSSQFFKDKAKLEEEAREHGFLTILAMASKDLGTEIALYECAETDPEQLPDTELKGLLRFLRGFVFMEKGFYYLSENEYTQNLEWLKKNKNVDLSFTMQTLQLGHLNKEESRTAYHGMNCLFRGVDRLMMERDIDGERAVEDFESVLKDCKKLKLDNELVWVVDSYVQLKKGNKEQAIVSLKKLKKSDLLLPEDREIVEESITYLKKDDSEKVLKDLYDKVFMLKITGNFLYNRIAQVNTNKLIKQKQVPNASKIAKKVAVLEEAVGQIDRFRKGKTLKEVGEAAGKEGGKLLDEAKELLPEF